MSTECFGHYWAYPDWRCERCGILREVAESSASPSVSPSLRDRIANVIHDNACDNTATHTVESYQDGTMPCLVAADAVVALLGLTEQWAWGYDFDEDGDCTMYEVESLDAAETFAAVWKFDAKPLSRLVGPWLPVNPDSTETTT